MPSRNLVYEALILRARESPGGSRILTLMTGETGLVDVFVFGGPKSKLRSLASPYASGRAFVYLDPVKEFQKLSDFEVHDSYPSLRDDLVKLWAAAFVAEILVKTSGGGGDFHMVLELALECLAALDGRAVASGDSSRGGVETSEAALLLFLWRLINLIGLGPDPTSCASCGRELRPSLGAAYSFSLESFLCKTCASEGDRVLYLGTGALRWLTRSLELPYEQAFRLVLLPETLDTLKSLVFGLMRKSVESPIASLEPGMMPL